MLKCTGSGISVRRLLIVGVIDLVLFLILVISLICLPFSLNAQTTSTAVKTSDPIVQYGMMWKGNWASSTTYNKNDVVAHNGLVYVSTIPNNTNDNPATVLIAWTQIGTVNGSSGSGTVLQGAGISSINNVTGAFVITGTGVSCVGNTCTVPGLNVPTATSSTNGLVRPDNSTITINNGVLSAIGGGNPPVATSSTNGVVRPDNSTITIANGVLSAPNSGSTVPVATSSTNGISRPDNSTIVVANGVLSVPSNGNLGTAAAGGATNSLQIKDASGALAGAGFSTDATHSDVLGVRHLTAQDSILTSTNCGSTAPWGTSTCHSVSTNSQLFSNYRSDVLSSTAEALLYQQTGPGWNSANVANTQHNNGWRTGLVRQPSAIFFSRGIHDMVSDGAQAMKCFAVGDCIHEYDYDFYDGGTNAPSDESRKWLGVIQTESQGFLHATVSSITSVNGSAPYPTGAQVVTANLTNAAGTASGSEHITDGTKLMDDPTTAGALRCQFNGAPTSFDNSGIGRIPVTNCTGSIPTVYTWGTINTMIGDTVLNGQVTANVPVSQNVAVTLGAGEPAFQTPDGSRSWPNFVCVVGQNYIENDRLYAVSGNTLTVGIRYPNNGPIHIFQGPACGPNQSISIDSSLTYGQQASSFWSFGTIDNGATLLFTNQAGGGVGYSSVFRTDGSVPWVSSAANGTPGTPGSTFHLVNSAEIVANNAANAFAPISALLEDNGYFPGVGSSVWDPHSNNVTSEGISIVDGTSQYGGGAAGSDVINVWASGPRITSAYSGIHVHNSNAVGMYKYYGGWASEPGPAYSVDGAWGVAFDSVLAPSGAFLNVGNWRPGQTSMRLYNSPNGVITHNILSNGAAEIDFSNNGAGSIRTSYLTIPKHNANGTRAGDSYLGKCNTFPFISACLGNTVNIDTGQVSSDGSLTTGSVQAGLYQGMGTSPTTGTSCTTVGWSFNTDGGFSFCNGSVWTTKNITTLSLIAKRATQNRVSLHSRKTVRRRALPKK